MKRAPAYPLCQEPLLALARHKLRDLLPEHIDRLFPKGGWEGQVLVGFVYEGHESTLEVGIWRDGRMEWGVSAGDEWQGNTITLSPFELLP